MGAVLPDLAVLEHHYQVCVLDGGQAVSDHNAGAAFSGFVQGFLDNLFDIHVNEFCYKQPSPFTSSPIITLEMNLSNNRFFFNNGISEMSQVLQSKGFGVSEDNQILVWISSEARVIYSQRHDNKYSPSNRSRTCTGVPRHTTSFKAALWSCSTANSGRLSTKTASLHFGLFKIGYLSELVCFQVPEYSTFSRTENDC